MQLSFANPPPGGIYESNMLYEGPRVAQIAPIQAGNQPQACLALLAGRRVYTLPPLLARDAPVREVVHQTSKMSRSSPLAGRAHRRYCHRCLWVDTVACLFNFLGCAGLCPKP